MANCTKSANKKLHVNSARREILIAAGGPHEFADAWAKRVNQGYIAHRLHSSSFLWFMFRIL